MKMVMGRRGFLLGEFTLKTVLAVVCILLLVFLLASFYASFSKEKSIAQAKGSLEQIRQGISIAGSTGKYAYILTEPRGWALAYFPAGLGSSGVCEGTGNRCLCICKAPGWFSNQKKQCEGSGICISSDVSLKMTKDKVISGATEVQMKRIDGGVVELT